MAKINALRALVNVDADLPVVVEMGVGARAGGTEALKARARVRCLQVGARRKWWAVARVGCRQWRGDRALVDVGAIDAVAPVARRRAGARVRAAKLGIVLTGGVSARGARRADVGAECTFVDVRARDAVAGVARRACARERACRIGAPTHVEAVVRARRALVDLRAGRHALLVAACAAARATGEVWRVGWAACACARARAIARRAACVARCARRPAARIVC